MTAPSHQAHHSRHRAAGKRRTSGRARALVALGAVAALGTGLSVQGTFAQWTDGASAQTGTFTSGTLDITLNGELAGIDNNGGTWKNTGFSLGSASGSAPMQPGESTAVSFPVRNNGTTPLVYSVLGTGTGALAVANGMQYSVTFGQTASTSGTAAAGNRAGSCGGTVATDTNTTGLLASATSPTPLPGAASRSLAVGASETVCIVARLSSAAPNGLQDKSGSASMLFDAKQPTAP